MTEPVPRSPEPLKSYSQPSAGGAGAPSGARSSGANLAWASVGWASLVVALGGVWWWFGRPEPVAPHLPAAENRQISNPGAPEARPEWAENVRRRDMAEIAARRTQAARQRMSRQVLGAASAQRSGSERSPRAIPLPTVADAGSK